jgi:hypothetical protein
MRIPVEERTSLTQTTPSRLQSVRWCVGRKRSNVQPLPSLRILCIGEYICTTCGRSFPSSESERYDGTKWCEVVPADEFPAVALIQQSRDLVKNRARKPRGSRLGPVRDCYFVTTNSGLLLSVPDGVTTETLPVVAPAGTVARMKVSFSTVKFAGTPLNVTLVDPVRP